ncbi:MAG: helix-turn-helix domain-containing protein [Desulfotomaculum sp.]|nr:helix-turn-helix domain-containing protein [Desulfotomaculum sp.]
MSFGKRLKKLREEKGLTQEELGQKLNLKKAVISKYENNRLQPSLETINYLASFFNVTADYLLGLSDHRNPLPPEAIPVGKTKKIPVLGIIRTGEPIYADEHIIGYEDVPVSDINDGEYFFLVEQGDSMIGSRIYPGDKVLVRRQNYVENTDIAVVIVNGNEATLKRVKPIEEAVILYPDNPMYKPQIYKAEEVRIIGKVVKVVFEV